METVTANVQLTDFVNLLSDRNILKITEPVWTHMPVYHGSGCRDYYKAADYPEIRSQFNHLNKVPGLYAYWVSSRCIYIGVSKDLRERIYQHLLESSDVWGHPRYREAFMKYTGLVDLYYLPLGEQSREGDFLRSIVEKVLQVHHDPELKSIKI